MLRLTGPQSHAPAFSLENLSKAARTLSLFSSRIVRLFRHTKSPYSYDRATIGLSAIRDTSHSLKPLAASTASALLLRNSTVSSTGESWLGSIEEAPGIEKGGHATGAWQGGLLSDAGPILDAQAKAEYKHRLDDLRRDLEEAERFNDPARAERARGEMECPCRAARLGRRTRRTESKDRFRSGTRALRSDQANQKLNQENR